jgi:predicted TIM-barrel fold metal-dependent hydrolase
MRYRCLARLVSVSQVLFGTDFPYLDGAEAVEELRDYGFNAADAAAIGRGNALALMPGLKG